MKTFNDTPQILTIQELLASLRGSPLTRMLVYSNDLSADEFDKEGVATRTDDLVLLIVDDGKIVGVIGNAATRDRHGRFTPEDISAAMRDAENGAHSAELRWVYDGAFALPEHPRAENQIRQIGDYH